MSFPEFRGFNKIARLSREIIITEKLDGTNGIIHIDENNNICAGSRTRWLWSSLENNEIKNDNHGFGNWVRTNQEELLKLGKGTHYGEFWGKGIQRGYGLEEKRFSLFNVSRWVKRKGYSCLYRQGINGIPSLKEKQEYCPNCCHVVPILYQEIFSEQEIEDALYILKTNGSVAAPGFMNPEGICIYHTAANIYFKKTIENDEGKNEKVQN